MTLLFDLIDNGDGVLFKNHCKPFMLRLLFPQVTSSACALLSYCAEAILHLLYAREGEENKAKGKTSSPLHHLTIAQLATPTHMPYRR